MHKKLPPLPGLALAIIIVLGLLVAAMALHITIIDGAEGAGPAQGFTPKYRDALIAWTTNPDDRLGLKAQLPTNTAVKFAMPTPSDSWELQRWDEGTKETPPEWRCATAATKSTDDNLGRVITIVHGANHDVYLRGVEPPDFGDACTTKSNPDSYATIMVSKPDDELAQISRMMLIRYGAGPQNPVPTPPGYKTDTLQTTDDLLYQAPGGDWVTQMLVSVGAAVAVMVVLRNATGLMMGIMVMPVSAFAMALIGYGSYWYVTVMALIFVLTVAAFTILTRRPSG